MVLVDLLNTLAHNEHIPAARLEDLMVFFSLLVVFHLHRLQLSQPPIWALRIICSIKTQRSIFPRTAYLNFSPSKNWTGKLGVLSIFKEVETRTSPPEMSRGWGHSKRQGGYSCLTPWHVTSANICTCPQLLWAWGIAAWLAELQGSLKIKLNGGLAADLEKDQR